MFRIEKQAKLYRKLLPAVIIFVQPEVISDSYQDQTKELKMGKGKQNRDGQALRKQQIINYIRENGPVKGSEICRDLEMSRSSL